MNDIEKQNLLASCKAYKNVRININEFMDILGDFGSTFSDGNFNPITNRNILMTGLYVQIFNANVYWLTLIIWIMKLVDIST
jgi:hypothetical protein